MDIINDVHPHEVYNESEFQSILEDLDVFGTGLAAYHRLITLDIMSTKGQDLHRLSYESITQPLGVPIGSYVSTEDIGKNLKNLAVSLWKGLVKLLKTIRNRLIQAFHGTREFLRMLRGYNRNRIGKRKYNTAKELGNYKKIIRDAGYDNSKERDEIDRIEKLFTDELLDINNGAYNKLITKRAVEGAYSGNLAFHRVSITEEGTMEIEPNVKPSTIKIGSLMSDVSKFMNIMNTSVGITKDLERTISKDAARPRLGKGAQARLKGAVNAIAKDTFVIQSSLYKLRQVAAKITEIENTAIEHKRTKSDKSSDKDDDKDDDKDNDKKDDDKKDDDSKDDDSSK